MDIWKAKKFKEIVNWTAEHWPKSFCRYVIQKAMNSKIDPIKKYVFKEFPENPELVDIAKTKRYIEDVYVMSQLSHYNYFDLQDAPVLLGSDITFLRDKSKLKSINDDFRYAIEAIFISKQIGRLKYTLFLYDIDTSEPDANYYQFRICTFDIVPEEVLTIPSRVLNECLHRIATAETYEDDRGITFVSAPNKHLPFEITGRQPHSVVGHWRLLPSRTSIGHKPDGTKIKGITWVKGHSRSHISTKTK